MKASGKIGSNGVQVSDNVEKRFETYIYMKFSAYMAFSFIAFFHVLLVPFFYHGIYGSRGKQWQPTPKNLPRMQCARAIPVA